MNHDDERSELILKAIIISMFAIFLFYGIAFGVYILTTFIYEQF